RIQDRTEEHLGKTDVGIIRYRRMLRAAIQAVDGEGEGLKMQNGTTEQITGPVSVDAIGEGGDWTATWRARDAERRAGCDWARG
ncbi:aromatic ring-hydroxylating dioxygenase subunit alpha, partial [Cribrihabitans sp. XS_ASV171]